MAFEYTAVIRTLGRAGEKYQALLDSLVSQTIRPKDILVYIADGYDLPKETAGVERYIRCPKGMVAQRSLPFDEVHTEYILFLDDDLFLPDDAVEKMYCALIENSGDVISPDVFPNHRASVAGKIKAAVIAQNFPRANDGWAFKIHSNATYSYNNRPDRVVCPTQSFAGSCSFMKKSVYDAIHFDDERWMDNFKYALGDDLVFSYKMYLYGYKLLVHYNTGIVHLDAGTSGGGHEDDRIRVRAQLWFIIWYRIRYDLSRNGVWNKMSAVMAYGCRILWNLMLNLLRTVFWLSFVPICAYCKGSMDGYRYVHTEEYRKIPKFDARNR